jgi:hypothetical protein
LIKFNFVLFGTFDKRFIIQQLHRHAAYSVSLVYLFCFAPGARSCCCGSFGFMLLLLRAATPSRLFFWGGGEYKKNRL